MTHDFRHTVKVNAFIQLYVVLTFIHQMAGWFGK